MGGNVQDLRRRIRCISGGIFLRTRVSPNVYSPEEDIPERVNFREILRTATVSESRFAVNSKNSLRISRTRSNRMTGSKVSNRSKDSKASRGSKDNKDNKASKGNKANRDNNRHHPKALHPKALHPKVLPLHPATADAWPPERNRLSNKPSKASAKPRATWATPHLTIRNRKPNAPPTS
jgi:hypothetical protein